MAPALLIGLSVAGCAALTCQPVSVPVAQKEERARVANVSQGLYRTTETGRLEPVATPGIVREYWVRSERGEWYRITDEQFKTAEVGSSIELCR